jgi:hypothetical protein
MSETDVLRQLVDGSLLLCSVPGCSNTFEKRMRGQRNCNQDDCARYMRTCDGPFCTNLVSRRRTDGKGGGKRWNYCSKDCEHRMKNVDRHIAALTPEQVLTVQTACVAIEAGDTTRNLGGCFQTVQEAVRSGSSVAIFNALTDAAASCLAVAAERGTPPQFA